MILQRKILTISCLSVISAFAAIHFIALTLTPLNLIIKFDPRFSNVVQEKINSYIQGLQIKFYAANTLHAEIKHHFGALKKLEIAYNASQRLFLHLEAASPLLNIKDSRSDCEFILTDQGIIEAWNYDKSSLKDLSTIFLDSANTQDELLQPEFYNCISALAEDIFENYKVVWRSKTDIQLNSKKYKDIVIIADFKSILEKSKFIETEKIYKSKELKKNEVMKADIRFRDFIVCTHLRGGWLYEDTKK